MFKSSMSEFREFEIKYNKMYSSPQERKARYEVFVKNLAEIRSHNSKPNVSWTMGINQFTDMPSEEFKEKILMSRFPMPHAGSGGRTVSLRKRKMLKHHVDWREHPSKPITPPRYQGHCGSCWAHAAAAQIESYSILKYPENRTLFSGGLSVEQLTACMPNPSSCGGGGGCEGATTQDAYRWIQSYGLTTEEAYPYISGPLWAKTGEIAKCILLDVISHNPRVGWTRGYETLPSNDYWAHLEHLSEVGPLDIAISLGGLKKYKGGIMMDEACDDYVIGHLVQLVGYGTNEEGVPYWIAKNSWGETWGEGGYFRMLREEHPSCGINNQTLMGVGCKDDGIPEVTYCGCLGMLSASAYPFIV